MWHSPSCFRSKHDLTKFLHSVKTLNFSQSLKSVKDSAITAKTSLVKVNTHALLGQIINYNLKTKTVMKLI